MPEVGEQGGHGVLPASPKTQDIASLNTQPEVGACKLKANAVCRVCLEEDSLDTLTQPCSCSGSMQFVHPDCLQTWINEKGSKSCEICQQAYQGAYTFPAPRTATQAERSALLTQLQMQGVIVRADRSRGTITLQRQHAGTLGPLEAVLAPTAMQEEEEDQEEASPSGAAWCFTAVMAFMAMLLIRHLFELFDTEHEVQPTPHEHPAEGGLGPEASAGMLLLWLTVRFLVILIPMYAVLRVMHTVRDQQVQDEADRDLDQELAALLWSMEAGPGQTPVSARVIERAAARAAERAAARTQEREIHLPLIV
ncbi:hypothetical protein ABBQ32_002044 [Trebouxia sp. C0010 RCD-2024]